MPKLLFGTNDFDPANTLTYNRYNVSNGARRTEKNFTDTMIWIAETQREQGNCGQKLREAIKKRLLILHDMNLRCPHKNKHHELVFRHKRLRAVVLQHLRLLRAQLAATQATWAQLTYRRKRITKHHSDNILNKPVVMRPWRESSAICIPCNRNLGVPLESVLPDVLHIEDIIELIGSFHQVPLSYPNNFEWRAMKSDKRYDSGSLVCITNRVSYYICRHCQKLYGVKPGAEYKAIILMQQYRQSR